MRGDTKLAPCLALGLRARLPLPVACAASMAACAAAACSDWKETTHGAASAGLERGMYYDDRRKTITHVGPSGGNSRACGWPAPSADTSSCSSSTSAQQVVMLCTFSG